MTEPAGQDQSRTSIGEVNDLLGLGKVGADVVRILERLLLPVWEPLASELGEAAADPVRRWRLKRQERAEDMLKGADSAVRTQGRTPQAVPGRVLIPLLESGSLEEDDELRRLWVAMLSHAEDPATEVKVTPSYPEILKQLSHIEVRILDWLVKQPTVPDPAFNNSGVQDVPMVIQALKAEVVEQFALSERDFEIVAINLDRMGLCEAGHNYVLNRSGGSPTSSRFYSLIRLTPLGLEFMKACTYG